MNLDEASKLAVNLLYLHNLTPEWGFRFDGAKGRQGLCQHGPKIISISRHWTEVKDAEWFTQTMLHEIAHAHCGHGNGHNKVWQAYATMIGYKHDKTDETFVKGDTIIIDTPTLPKYHGIVAKVTKVNRVNLEVKDLKKATVIIVNPFLVKRVDSIAERV